MIAFGLPYTDFGLPAIDSRRWKSSTMPSIGTMLPRLSRRSAAAIEGPCTNAT